MADRNVTTLGPTHKPRHASVFNTHSDTQAVPAFQCIQMFKGLLSTRAFLKRTDTLSTNAFKSRHFFDALAFPNRETPPFEHPPPRLPAPGKSLKAFLKSQVQNYDKVPLNNVQAAEQGSTFFGTFQGVFLPFHFGIKRFRGNFVLLLQRCHPKILSPRPSPH